jgi:cation diffusion facilitator family transporter
MKEKVDNSMAERERKIRSITLWGILANFFLVIIKIIFGVIVRSSALVADGFHSISDLATDFIVLISTHLSSRPPDETHPYGHKKFETIATQLIGLVLMGVGLIFVWKAGAHIYRGEISYPGFMVLVVAGISILLKELLFVWTRKISLETLSTALYANAWHHRSDSLSSVAVLIGGIASLIGWGHADHVATIAVGLMIMGVAGKILYDGLIELSEHAADKESIQKLKDVLDRESDVFEWHALRTRKVGGELFVDVHLVVDPDLSVKTSHEICSKVEKKMLEELTKPANILIHCDPLGVRDETEEERES